MINLSRKKEKRFPKAKTRKVGKVKVYPIARTEMDYKEAQVLAKEFRREHKVNIKEIQKTEIVSHTGDKYHSYKVIGYNGSEWYLFDYYDDLETHAIDVVERNFGEYQEAGWVDEDSDIGEFVRIQGFGDILASYDGAIYETEDSKPYYRFN